MRIIDKTKSAFVRLKNRWVKAGKRKIDFYSSKYDFVDRIFLVFLFVYGIYLFQIIAQVTVALILRSWQLFFDILPQFFAVLTMYIILMFILAYVRKVTLFTFIEEPKQRPPILWNCKIATAAMNVFQVSYYPAVLSPILIGYTDYFPDFAKQWPVLIACGLITFTSILFLFIFSMSLRLSNKEIVLYGLDYLSKVHIEDGKTLMDHIGFISMEVVENLHKLFLSHWKFAQQINLWPQFNIVLLGLICGKENEQKATTALLMKLHKMINDKDDSESCRQVAESLDEFQISMKSLSELKDTAKLKGSPTIRRPRLQKIREFAPIATIFGPIITILVFIIQMII